MLTSLNPANAVWPGVSQGVIMKGNGLFVTSGHGPVDAKGELVTGSFEIQFIAVFYGIAATLAAAGPAFEHGARIVTYVTDYEPSMVHDGRLQMAFYRLTHPGLHA
jgi:enamine deaminase RidA (YjgF/YER057c/UK114 family)